MPTQEKKKKPRTDTMWWQCWRWVPCSLMGSVGEAGSPAFFHSLVSRLRCDTVFLSCLSLLSRFPKTMLNTLQNNYRKLRMFLLFLVNITKQRWSWSPQLQDENIFKSNLRFFIFLNLLLRLGEHSLIYYYFFSGNKGILKS